MAFHTTLLHRMDALSAILWRIYSFEIPLISGKVRQGLAFCLKDIEGNEKWGEVSPNSCRNIESTAQAREQLLAFLQGGFTGELFPSVQFGLESALSPPLLPITAPLYAFVSGSKEEILTQADRAKTEGYTVIKVKISSLSTEDATDVLKALKSHFRLRVDCSSKFTLKEANDFFSSFDPSLFDYIEDPTHELKELHKFTHPFAIEEAVLQYNTLPIETYSNFYGFILKPTVIGGKKGCAPLVDFANKHRLKVVFSPAFETGLGLLQILKLAKHFNLLKEPIGLDTHRHLKYDLLETGINFNVPKLTITTLPPINLKHLTEIAHGTCPMPHL